MATFFSFFFIVALATIFSCNHLQKHMDQMEDKESLVSGADKITQIHSDATVAPRYYRGYSITVTEDNLHLAINSYGDTLLTKDFSFSEKKWTALKASLESIEKANEIDRADIPTDGSSERLIFYKNNKEIFKGEKFGGVKNYKGGDISLVYLVPELDALIESTRQKQD